MEKTRPGNLISEIREKIRSLTPKERLNLIESFYDLEVDEEGQFVFYTGEYEDKKYAVYIRVDINAINELDAEETISRCLKTINNQIPRPIETDLFVDYVEELEENE